MLSAMVSSSQYTLLPMAKYVSSNIFPFVGPRNQNYCEQENDVCALKSVTFLFGAIVQVFLGPMTVHTHT